MKLVRVYPRYKGVEQIQTMKSSVIFEKISDIKEYIKENNIYYYLENNNIKRLILIKIMARKRWNCNKIF